MMNYLLCGKVVRVSPSYESWLKELTCASAPLPPSSDHVHVHWYFLTLNRPEYLHATSAQPSERGGRVVAGACRWRRRMSHDTESLNDWHLAPRNEDMMKDRWHFFALGGQHHAGEPDYPLISSPCQEAPDEAGDSSTNTLPPAETRNDEGISLVRQHVLGQGNKTPHTHTLSLSLFHSLDQLSSMFLVFV